MKLARKKPVSLVKQKKSFDAKEFINSINSLTKDNYGSAPLAVRLFVLAMIIAGILALAWFLLLSKKLDEIAAAESEQAALIEQYQERESKARYLDEYKAQVVQMEIEFKELLNRLPKDTRVSELIEGINMVGSGSGIRFQDITVEPEVEQEFFIEQPIKIQSLGRYHQFGDFIAGLIELPRIITLHDFELVNTQPSLEVVPDLQLTLNTKTYRTKEVVEMDSADNSADAATEEGAN